MEHEVRCFNAETRVTEKSDRLEILGHAAVFNMWTDEKIMGQFQERIAPGSFGDSIKKHDIRMLYNHDQNMILARNKKGNKQGTLKLWEDEIGLAYSAELDKEVTFARDAYQNIKNGNISQNSFMFDALEDDWNKTCTKRELKKIKLYEVSPVTFPAYSQTTVQARSLFHDCGLDYSSFMMTILKAKRNINISDEEKEIFKEQINIISGFFPPECIEKKEAREEQPGLINGLSFRQYVELQLLEVD